MSGIKWSSSRRWDNTGIRSRRGRGRVDIGRIGLLLRQWSENDLGGRSGSSRSRVGYSTRWWDLLVRGTLAHTRLLGGLMFDKFIDRDYGSIERENTVLGSKRSLLRLIFGISAASHAPSRVISTRHVLVVILVILLLVLSRHYEIRCGLNQQD